MSAGPISVREGWSVRELVSAGWQQSELDWEEMTAQAMANLAAGDASDAKGAFGAAYRLARAEFAEADPRRAASLANHAAAIGSAELSESARTAWTSLEPWISRMTAPRTARSSLFHLRMEQRHRPEYEERWRVKARELAGGARGQLSGDGALGLIGAQEAGERAARWGRERPVSLTDPRKIVAATTLLAARGG